MALNAKQRAFVREYRKNPNATQAAKNAGYSPKTAYSQGQRLLKHVEVNAAIAKAEAKTAAKCELDRQWVLDRLKEEAESAEKSSERTRAIELIGRAVSGGIFTDKREVDVGKKLEDILREAGEEE